VNGTIRELVDNCSCERWKSNRDVHIIPPMAGALQEAAGEREQPKKAESKVVRCPGGDSTVGFSLRCRSRFPHFLEGTLGLGLFVGAPYHRGNPEQKRWMGHLKSLR
jgi:hypothetical protein